MKIWKKIILFAAVLLLSAVMAVTVFAHPVDNRGHPAQQATGPSLNARRVLNFSNNWAGYIATGGTFTSVSGSWVVPQVNATGTSSDATWVGIGGTTSRDLIQIGTRAVADNRGRINYQAWYEVLPANSQKISLTISPGDSITASISRQSANQWAISLVDSTTGQNYQTTVTYSSSLSSAEWIEEMPVLGRSFIPLDNFGSVQFSALSTIKDGTLLTPSQANAKSIVMVNSLNQAVAQPSALGIDGASFTVTRTTASTPTQTVSPISRTGWRRMVIGIHGFAPHSRHGRGRFSVDLVQDSKSSFPYHEF